jgi:type IV pilus assembly protein PilC
MHGGALQPGELTVVEEPPDRWFLPLPVALRTAAAEVESSALRRALDQLAMRLDSGEPMESALSAAGDRLPPFLRVLLRGSARTAQPARIFARYVAQARETAEVQRFLRMSFLMPVLLVGFTASILLFSLVWVVPRFKSIFADFGTELPAPTRWTIGMSDFVVGFLPLFVVPLGLIFGFLVILIAGARLAPFQPIVSLVPILGGAMRKAALSDYCEYLALLVECRTPLPEAVELASLGAKNAGLRSSAWVVAGGLRQGEPPDEAVRKARWFPPVLRNAFRHAGDQATFTRVLEGLRDLYRAESQRSTTLIPLVVVPMVVVGVGITLLFVIVSIFLPLFKLLNDLS